MIASLSGTIQDISPDSIVIELGGVGMQVYLPTPVHEQLKLGQTVFLYTYLVVREDSLTLYGFDSRESKELFGLLLGVSGIGPRLALSVLSTLTPEAIRRAVFHEQAEVFNRVPGVGKKTSQKILLHLQDRVPAEAGLEPVAEFSEVDGEVLNALTALGYSVVEAQAAIQTIPRDTAQDVEVRLRLALQYFSAS
ncbi:MAG: Holliday junction branch migration protein RuvA [Anaerolineales bacterium]|jgi:Holliday junction DNA helicase RuvA